MVVANEDKRWNVKSQEVGKGVVTRNNEYPPGAGEKGLFNGTYR